MDDEVRIEAKELQLDDARWNGFDDTGEGPTRWLGDAGMTLAEIALWASQHGVPSDAKVRYAGCGSHAIEFAWEEGSVSHGICGLDEAAWRSRVESIIDDALELTDLPSMEIHETKERILHDLSVLGKTRFSRETGSA